VPRGLVEVDRRFRVYCIDDHGDEWSLPWW
jgi:hypothetical protein